MKHLILFFGFFILTSCVKKSEYEKLKSDYNELENKFDSISAENVKLSEFYNKKIEEELKIAAQKYNETRYSDDDARTYLKDWYNFYNANMVYRNERIRKFEYNKFIISLEECTNKPDFKNNNFFWNSRVLTLTINENGTYTVKYGSN